MDEQSIVLASAVAETVIEHEAMPEQVTAHVALVHATAPGHAAVPVHFRSQRSRASHCTLVHELIPHCTAHVAPAQITEPHAVAAVQSMLHALAAVQSMAAEAPTPAVTAQGTPGGPRAVPGRSR